MMLAVGAGALVVQAGGIDPSLAYLLEPQRAAWPGNGVRGLAVRVVGRRQMHPDTLRALVRMAHTLHSGDDLWRSVVARSGTVLGIGLSPDDDPPETLERLDTRAAQVLGEDVTRVGVLAWWPLDPYWTMWLDDLSGDDASLALERYNRLASSDGLPTSEWYLAWLALAFADDRPIPFDIIAEGFDDRWVFRAVPLGALPAGARRVDAGTVGDALIVGLWNWPEYRVTRPDVDPRAWWDEIASARRLPPGQPRPR